MRKKSPWFTLKTIVPALLVLPPLGLVLLWRSPHSKRMKIAVSTVFAVLLIVASAAVVRSGLHEDWLHPRIPASGFDVSRDSRGHYKIKRVLPLERQVFNEVVRQVRALSAETNWTSQRGEGVYSADPETLAINRVARRHNLDPDDVSMIYLKVSGSLAPDR